MLHDQMVYRTHKFGGGKKMMSSSVLITGECDKEDET